MPFIAPTTKLARLWVDVVSKSLQIEKSDTAEIYARLCGFNNWDQVVGAINRGKPSPSDESVSQDVLETRHKTYIECLVDEFGMQKSLSEHIIERASPSSSRKPQRFSIDTEALFGAGRDDGLNLKEMFESLGGGADGKDMEQMLEDFAREALGDSMPEDFSFDNFADRMRISKPIDPGLYCDMVETIGWDVVEGSFNPEYEYGEESFAVWKEGEQVPVYLTSLTRAPHDVDDEMADRVMELVEAHAAVDLGADEALLFWGGPSMKQIRGHMYTHFGMYLTGGKWHEFVISKDMTIDDIFSQHLHAESVDSPRKSWSDKDAMLAVGVVRAMHGIPDGEKVSFVEVGTQSGWNTILPGDGDDLK